MAKKGANLIETSEKQFEKAINVLSRNVESYSPPEIPEDKQKDFQERFVSKGLKRGLFWLWWENRKLRDNRNFIEVKDFEDSASRVGLKIRTSKIKVKRYRKPKRGPIEFHKESLEEWLRNKFGIESEEGLDNPDKLKGQRFPSSERDPVQEAWYERFVKKGLRRGHLRLWWENRKLHDNRNFIEVKTFEKPPGKVGLKIRAGKVKIKRYRKPKRGPIEFHKESLEEWLIKKTIYHAKNLMKELS